MRRVGVAVAALVIFLTGASDAPAAATARLLVFPERPRVGEAVTLQLRTFVPLTDGSSPPVAIPKSYPWLVYAYSPNGRSLRIRVTRDPNNPYLWSGTLRFRARGAWTVCALNMQGITDPKRGCLRRVNPTRTVIGVQPKNASTDIWHRLQRPLRIPMIPGGTQCPTSKAQGDLTRIGFVGIAWGQGPAYPGLAYAVERAVLRYEDPIPRESLFFGSAWYGQKVLWAVDEAYGGPVLVRGLQLNGPNELRFDQGIVPAREMRIVPAPPPRGRPSYTRVRAPGCYGYQVDGVGFSYVVVFEARPF